MVRRSYIVCKVSFLITELVNNYSEILGEKDKGFEDYLRNIDCKDVEI